jgi:hypothetical protein
MICNPTIIVKPEIESSEELCRASADWNDSMLKLASPCFRCWSIYVFVYWLNNCNRWQLCVEWNGCDGFHYSEYLRCWSYNPVGLLYAFLLALSALPTCLWALVFVGSGVQGRSGFWGSIVSSSGVSSGWWWCTSSMVYGWMNLLTKLIDGHSGAPTEVEPGWLGLIPACRWYNRIRQYPFIHQYWVILFIVRLELVPVKWFPFGHKALDMFPTPFDHSWGMVTERVFRWI